MLIWGFLSCATIYEFSLSVIIEQQLMVIRIGSNLTTEMSATVKWIMTRYSSVLTCN